jgi:hypothetical protein
LTIMVNRRCVAKLFQIKRPHRLKHLRQYRCRGVVIKVNAAHTSILRLVFRFSYFGNLLDADENRAYLIFRDGCIQKKGPRHRRPKIQKRLAYGFSPYTSSSPWGDAIVTGSCAVVIKTFPFTTIGAVNLIPKPGTSAAFCALEYSRRVMLVAS